MPPEASKPTLGRIVRVWDRHSGFLDQEMAAIVTAVHSPECVSVTAFPFNNAPFALTSLSLTEPEASARGWRWPPRD